MQEELDRLCFRIGGLKKSADGHWIAALPSPVSYPTASHAALAEIEASSFWYNHRNRVISSVVSQFPPQGPILDIGGGNGFVSLGLRQAGFSPIVIEPGLLGARASRDRGLPVIEAAFESLTVPDKSIFAAGLFDVLEHVAADDITLGRLYAMLRNGGRLYLTVPALPALWSQADHDGGHYRRYSKRGLSGQLRRLGFRVRYGSYFFGPLVLPLLLFKALPYRIGLGRRATASSVTEEHHLPDNWLGQLFLKFLVREKKRIASGVGLGLGASLIVVAEKP